MIMNYLHFDYLANFIAIFVVFFSLLTILYSVGFMKGKKGLIRYYLYLLLTMLASLGAVFADNLIFFIACWGFLGMLLYLLIDFGEKERTAATAKKTFIIIGGTDAFMLLGIGLVWHLSGSMDMSKISLAFDNRLAVIAYLCLVVGAFAKAGAMPVHTWVPDTAEDAPTPVTAFLPASLDKLLGIYFLARISLDVFKMDFGMNTFLMLIGSVTVVAAVMMALIQHDMKRLLGYHAVSQVGYMVLGIGTGNPIGIAGGLFHMLNHAIYKSCLFFSGGSVENKTGTTDLDKLGGLAKGMPITFITFLIAAFAISGVPPFNGFASKWMVYQGVIETGRNGSHLWIIWLVAAMFGSALTLASFMKLVHAIFLGQPSSEQNRGEVGPVMLIPTIILASLCVIFGVLVYHVPLKLFIIPSLPMEVIWTGIWNASGATALIVVGLVIGFIIYLLGTVKKTRQAEIFIGGELVEQHPEMRLSGTEFYRTIQEMGILKTIYRLALKRWFDIYNVGSKLTFGFNKVLSYIHNGVLPTYLAWCLLGMLVLFYVLLR